MNTKIVSFVAALIMIPLVPLCYGQAYQPGNPSGYNPGNGQTYTYTVTSSDQPQYGGAVQYGGTGYTAVPAPPQQQHAVAQRPIQPRIAYQQPIQQAQRNQQARPSSKAAAKKKTLQTAAKNRNSLIAQPPSQRQQIPVARQYQPNYPAQPQPVYQQRYYQQPQSSYYTNPYQTQYTAAPNYYQGYYNSLGSSGQACPPGRA